MADSLNNLYMSVPNFYGTYFEKEANSDLLLSPQYSINVTNISGRLPTLPTFYTCLVNCARNLTTERTTICPLCRGVMNLAKPLFGRRIDELVQQVAKLMVLDDLFIHTRSMTDILNLMRDFNVTHVDNIQHKDMLN